MKSPNTKQSRDVANLRKGELHAHLNGVISANLVREILEDERVEVPDGFDLTCDLVRHSVCTSLNNYLKPWQVLRRIPSKPENLWRLTDDAFRCLYDNNVRFVELRSSVMYLSTLQNCRVHEALIRLLEATRDSASKYGISSGIILTVARGDYGIVHLDTLLSAYRDLGCPPDVVGLDLAGDEEIPIPEELPSRFKAAKGKYGLGVTIHAGETGRPENILSAINDFDADRIGHGTAAELDDYIMDTLRERDICVEVCPISNRLTGAVKEFCTHPLHKFQLTGVPFVICSDNPGIHEQGLNDDYAAAMKEGVSFDCLQNQYALAAKYSFLDTSLWK